MLCALCLSLGTTSALSFIAVGLITAFANSLLGFGSLATEVSYRLSSLVATRALSPVVVCVKLGFHIVVKSSIAGLSFLSTASTRSNLYFCVKAVSRSLCCPITEGVTLCISRSQLQHRSNRAYLYRRRLHYLHLCLWFYIHR